MTAELGGRYRKIAAMRARLRENLIDPRERERQLDILRFQRDEIDRMNLKEGEEEELTRQREKLVAGEQIARNLSEAFASVSGGIARRTPSPTPPTPWRISPNTTKNTTRCRRNCRTFSIGLRTLREACAKRRSPWNTTTKRCSGSRKDWKIFSL